jgi:hypothetical protein
LHAYTDMVHQRITVNKIPTGAPTPGVRPDAPGHWYPTAAGSPLESATKASQQHEQYNLVLARPTDGAADRPWHTTVPIKALATSYAHPAAAVLTASPASSAETLPSPACCRWVCQWCAHGMVAPCALLSSGGHQQTVTAFKPDLQQPTPSPLPPHSPPPANRRPCVACCCSSVRLVGCRRHTSNPPLLWLTRHPHQVTLWLQRISQGMQPCAPHTLHPQVLHPPRGVG